jgi:shikimate dehydrogenase
METSPLDGFNITLPYKEKMWENGRTFLTSTDRVRFSGAINTLIRTKDKRWEADNTDGIGFLEDLAANAIDVKGKNITILGAGGAARAVLFGLQTLAPRGITLINRSRARGEKFLEDFALFQKPWAVPVSLAWEERDRHQAITEADLVVNTTSLGLDPQQEHIIDFSWLHSSLILYDLIYHRETELMAASRKARAIQVVGGLGMLVRQAARSFELWFQQKPPLSLMMAAAQGALKS